MTFDELYILKEPVQIDSFKTNAIGRSISWFELCFWRWYNSKFSFSFFSTIKTLKGFNNYIVM